MKGSFAKADTSVLIYFPESCFFLLFPPGNIIQSAVGLFILRMAFYLFLLIKSSNVTPITLYYSITCHVCKLW